MKRLILILAIFAISCTAYAQKITDGTWFNEEKTSRIKFHMEGDKLYGKIVWIKEPNIDGKPKLDVNNPKVDLTTKPLMGLSVLKGFNKAGEYVWEDGTVYDPRNGKTYSCIITEKGKDKLDMRGYIGISVIGRSSVLIRATN